MPLALILPRGDQCYLCVCVRVCVRARATVFVFMNTWLVCVEAEGSTASPAVRSPSPSSHCRTSQGLPKLLAGTVNLALKIPLSRSLKTLRISHLADRNTTHTESFKYIVLSGTSRMFILPRSLVRSFACMDVPLVTHSAGDAAGVFHHDKHLQHLLHLCDRLLKVSV